MWSRTIIVCCSLLSACATVRPLSVPEGLLDDRRFALPSGEFRPGEVYRVSEPMKQYLRAEISPQARIRGPQRALIDALYRKGQLKLEYDTGVTRNAAEAFDARAGNCLSLVIMTAALAQELGLTVQYRNVFAEETYSRSGDITFTAGHVNLTLGTAPPAGYRLVTEAPYELTVDFLPQEDLSKQRWQPIGEYTVTAMYMNNKAAEALAGANLNDAYWWAREALRSDPGFLSSYITLGVVYRRHGQPALAEKALRYVLGADPENVNALSNLVVLLNDQGRVAEAARYSQQLARLEPYPPFYFYERGAAAIKARDFAQARDLFAKALNAAPYNHEFHFGLAAAYIGLGDRARALEHLELAKENSATRHDRELYAGKLARIESLSRRDVDVPAHTSPSRGE